MLVHPEFDPIAFHAGPIAVRWYGLMYLVGFVLFVVLGKYRARQNLLTGWHPRDVDDMLLYGVFGVILGGRLGYVLFYKPLYYLAHPLEILAVWQGGMSFHGGFLGVLVALWFFARSRRKRWLDVTDFVAPLACRWAWPPAGSATSSTANSGGVSPTCRRAMVFPPAGPVAAASVAALSIRSRGARPFCAAVGLHEPAAPAGRGVGPVPRRLRSSPASLRSSRASPTASSDILRLASRWANGFRCR